MSFIVIIPESVSKELDSVFSYYENLQPDLGVKFLDDWENTMEHLEQRPFIHPIQFKQFRSIQFNRFPFLIIFEVQNKNIVLLRIIHSRRNPARRYRKK